MTVLTISNSITSKFRYLTLTPFSSDTEEGRAAERHRLLVLSALASLIAKIISVGTTFISVPLTLHYLGAERYGMWMTMSSLIAMLSFADLGIGNGILNSVSAAYGRDDRTAIREHVSSGLFVLSAIGLAIAVAFAAAYSFVPWYRIFNVTSSQAVLDAGPSMAVFVVCFALAIPLAVVQRVQMALQRSFLANLWQCGASLLALAGVVLAVWLKAGLPWLVFAFVGSPLIAGLLNSLVFFGVQQPEYVPAPSAVSGRAMKTVAHVGMLFFVLQVVVSVAYASDNIVIAQVLDAKAVAAYAVPQRLFSIIPILLAMVLTPLWPAYGEAIARGDHQWANATLRRSLILSLGLAVPASVVLVVFGNAILRLWVGGAIPTSFTLLLGLGVWQVIQAAGNAASMYLNGANVVRLQLIVATTTGIAALLLKVALVYRIGIAGAVWSTVIAYMVCAAYPLYRKISQMMGAGAGTTDIPN